MDEKFDYDVFISFSNKDAQLVKEIWQTLSTNGLRVFWSDVNLREQLGESWFDVIQTSLENSRHFILICSDDSMKSKWVNREYKAFYNHCYKEKNRKLIPITINSYNKESLPLFLKELQVLNYKNAVDAYSIIDKLKDNTSLEVEALKKEINLLKSLLDDQVNKKIFSIDNDKANNQKTIIDVNIIIRTTNNNLINKRARINSTVPLEKLKIDIVNSFMLGNSEDFSLYIHPKETNTSLLNYTPSDNDTIMIIKKEFNADSFIELME